jgi:hypothetical protein
MIFYVDKWKINSNISDNVFGKIVKKWLSQLEI